MLSKRIQSSLFLAALTTLGIFNKWFFIIFIVVLTMGGLYEFFYLIRKKGIPIYSYIGIFIGAAIPVSIFTRFELTKNWELLFIVIGFLLLLLLQFLRGDNRNAIVGISTTLFGILYVSWFFSFLVKIRFLVPDDGGLKLLAFIIAVTKAGDIGALLIGRKIGKHALLSNVSPNKTIEGWAASLIFGGLTALVCWSFLPPALNYTLFQIFLIGVFFSAIGQLGDLSESMIKRDCDVKDSGKFLPGLGGILDIIDSLLFAAPAFYLYMSSALNTI
ncbi:MAG: phosphatidate cytidylyltransferase [Candidatus Omnitrophota bacterium]